MNYLVSFQYSETIYCTNIAAAEDINDVREHYSKYKWFDIKEASESEIESAKRKGMPVIEIEPEERKSLYDLTDNLKYSDRDGYILVDGKPYQYEMTLSQKYNDDECCRVKIDGEYYYFGQL